MSARTSCETMEVSLLRSNTLALTVACVFTTLTLATVAAGQRGYPGNFTPTNIAVGGSGSCQTAFFAANNGEGVEPWFWTTCPAVPQPPRLLADIAQTTSGQIIGSFPEEFTPIDHNRVFFTARTGVDSGLREERELYYFDAAFALVPIQVQSSLLTMGGIRPGDSGSIPLDLTLVGSTAAGWKVFFSADDGRGEGRELWVCDAGLLPLARRVSDINPGPGSSWPHNLVALNDTTILFAATDDRGDTELYMSTGTLSGTRRVMDINPGTSSSYPAGMTAFQGRVYFAATTASDGRELWETAGPGATRMVRPNGMPNGLRPGAASSNPSQITAGFSGALIPRLGLTATDSTGSRKLWLYRPDINRMVSHSVPNGHTVGELVEARLGPGLAWCFTYEDPALGREIGYFLSGDPSGAPLRSIDVRVGAEGSSPTSLERLPGGEILFRAADDFFGHEVFRSDTSVSPHVGRLVRDIKPGPGSRDASGRQLPKSSFPSAFVPFDGKFLFAAEGASNRRALWETDGFFGGTNPVMPGGGTPGCSLHGFVDESVPGNPMFNFSLTDAAPGSLVFFGFGTLPRPSPVVIPGISGALLLNADLGVVTRVASQPNPQIMDPGGNAEVLVALPTYTIQVIGVQALCSGVLAVAPSFSNLDPCQTTVGTGEVSNGAKADSCGCFNDETGEYNINLRRTDSVMVTTYHALVYTRPSGEQQLLMDFTLEMGEEIDIQGFADLFPADDEGDASGTKSVDLWMLEQPWTPQSTAPPVPTPCNTNTVCNVWSSYC